ncbi:MAG: PSD1 and planctomycete cytochrome C domain-containing protein [Planctomycetaceae bacterium]
MALLRIVHVVLVVAGYSAAISLNATYADDTHSGRSAPNSDRVSWNRDIRRILADNCFQCHGPDAGAREADLRLDQRNTAVADRDGSAAIVPGAPDNSLLIERISADDESIRMPPAATRKRLTDEERKLLHRWIEQGATYDDHWAFQPVADVAPPNVDPESARYVRNGVDAFIVQKLRASGLQPSRQADPATLVRRLYIDLVGLLPSPEVVEAFVADPSDAAYEQLVDDLLASPHYGERWGRHWLDQARYADSNGYTIDGDRTMWPYRDWVIKAINDDMPFDTFTIEQIAGDLLPHPTKGQLVATGFHRNTLINEEGGTDDEQFRNEEVIDRVNTTGAVWLGLTVGCAQCHSHKFDPITQEEFFRLFAFFNQTEDVNNVGPTVEVRENELLLDPLPPKLAEALTDSQQRIERLQATQQERRTSWETQYLAASEQTPVAIDWQPLRPVEFGARSAKLKLLDDLSLLADRGAEKETYEVSCELPQLTSVAAIRLRVLPHESLPKNGPGLADNGNFVLTGFRVKVGAQLVDIARTQASHHQAGHAVQNSIDGNSGSGWAINVTGRSDVKMNAGHEAYYVFDPPLQVEAGSRLAMTLEHQALEGFYNIGRFAMDVSDQTPGQVTSQEVVAALQTESSQRIDDQNRLIAEAFLQQDTELLAAQADLKAAREAAGFGSSTRCMVMKDLAEPRTTYRFIRGDFLRPDVQSGPLTADVPAIFPAMSVAEGQTPTRLDLAKWLVRADNPLTPRVFVNRTWLKFFGSGLVVTENDFGTQGSFPTHPELLDWLAFRFVKDGWSRKSLHRLIVTSATYRQSSRVSSRDAAGGAGVAESPTADRAGQVDPLNQLLLRQNRLRFEAEIVRDAALCVSGLLNNRIGGPSVRPPQPEGVYAFTQQNKNWKADAGPARYRRTMYTRFYRSAPHPMLTTFDSPDFQSVCTARVRSNTPLQSLTLANDEGLIEMAAGAGVKLLQDVPGTGRTQERIEHLYRTCFSRSPSDSERSAVVEFYQSELQHFSADSDAARQIVGRELPEGISAAEAASWTAVARALINTDEFITRE